MAVRDAGSMDRLSSRRQLLRGQTSIDEDTGGAAFEDGGITGGAGT